MKKTLLLIMLFCIGLGASAQQPKHETVNFEYGKYNLLSHEADKLHLLVESVKNKSVKKVVIIGHTDSDGSLDYNNQLSNNRAQMVYDYLINHGVSKEQVSVSFKGETEPIASNLIEKGKSENRRVEIVVHFKKFEVPQSFKVPYSEFSVDPSVSSSIQLDDKGTILHIPKYAFVDENGNVVKAIIDLKYRAFNNSADIAFSGIPMEYKTGGEQYNFNSSGMFELNGSSDGNEVKIAKGKSLTVDYALAKQNPDINFFALDRDSDRWTKVQTIEKNKVDLKQESLDTDINENYEIVVVNNIDVKNKIIKFKNGRELAVIERNRDDRVPGVNKKRLGNVRPRVPAIDNTLLTGFDAGHTYPDIVKGLNVGEFGVYNCDQVYRIQNKVAINASYTDEEGKPLKDIHVLSLIDLNYNGAFSFDPQSFQCDAKAKNVLALFTTSGDLFVLSSDQFQSMGISDSGNYTFKMKNMSDQIKSTDDLAVYLGLKI